jgi:lactate dehydrogenase-like 2-hydroxyacid dehydrogenase
MLPIGRMRTLLEASCDVLLWGEIPDHDAFFRGDAHRVSIMVGPGRIPFDATLLERFPNLEYIAYLGSGYEGLDVAYARARGLKTTNAANTNHEDVADIALGLMIATVRRLSEADAVVRSGAWTGVLPIRMTPSLRQVRYGIVGMGAIGIAIAERLQPLGGRISWWGPRPKPHLPWPRAASLMDLATDSEVLILALRADASNRGLIDAAVLSALGPSGYLINISRGFVVDEDALVEALRSGRLAGAGLDVFATEPTDPSRWRDIRSVALSPHLGGFAQGSIAEADRVLTENIRRHLAGEPLLSPIP